MFSSRNSLIVTKGKFTNMRTKKIKQYRRSLFIILFLAPGIILFLMMYAYPLINIFATSFTNWNFKNLSQPEFIGWDNLFGNYIHLFTKDYFFENALLNSLKWAALAALIQVPFATIVALVLSKAPRGWKFARNVFIIPNIISSAAIGLIFLNMYDPSRGLISLLLESITGKDLNLLANSTTAFWCVTGAFILFGGSIMLLILAQIMSVSKEIYEAAELDGASGLIKDIYITLPLIKPAIGTAFILACNYGLVIYNEIALITGGGPDGATYSLSFYIYKTAMGSAKLNFARANTAGVILFVIGLIVIGIINFAFNREKKES